MPQTLSAAPPPPVHRGGCTHEEEMRHLVDLYKGEPAPIMNALAGQFDILAGRSQTLLSLVGITISLTSMGGVNIARAGKLAAILLLAGLVLVISSAGMAILGILRIRWTTQMAPSSLESAILTVLARRDQKTKLYLLALIALVLGLTLYVASVAIMLYGNVPK